MEKNGMTREIPEDHIKFAEKQEESYNWKDDMDDLTSVVSEKLKDSNANQSDSSVGHV